MTNPSVTWFFALITGLPLLAGLPAAPVLAQNQTHDSTLVKTHANKKPAALSDIELGKRIYRDGILPNGQPLQARGAGNAVIKGTQISCISCHRRSGFGTSEGKDQAPAVIGKILFNQRTQTYRELSSVRLSGAGARPAYTEDSLLVAINKGTDSSGRELNPLMPRFNLSKADLKILVKYLNSIKEAGFPGVEEKTIHFATVFTPGTSAKQKSIVEQTINALFKDYDSQERHQRRRATNAPWHKQWQYDSYRDLKLHSWSLTGDPATWHKQLQKYYKKQPVFAILNGIGELNWQPIDEFCEQQEIPCLFPTTEIPVKPNQHYYTIYFTDGVKQEARSIAQHLQNNHNAQSVVIQIHNEQMGHTAATELVHALDGKNIKVIDVAIDPKQRLDDKFLNEKITPNKSATLVLWLNTSSITKIARELASNSKIDTIYVSTSIADHAEKTLPQAAKDKTYLVTQTVPEIKLRRHLLRFTPWAKSRKIDITDPRIASNAYFAALVTTHAIKNMRAHLSREYMIEHIEHGMERGVFYSVYPNFTLGPNQRIGSKGCFIIGPLTTSTNKSGPAAQWIVP